MTNAEAIAELTARVRALELLSDFLLATLLRGVPGERALVHTLLQSWINEGVDPAKVRVAMAVDDLVAGVRR